MIFFGNYVQFMFRFNVFVKLYIYKNISDLGALIKAGQGNDCSAYLIKNVMLPDFRILRILNRLLLSEYSE